MSDGSRSAEDPPVLALARDLRDPGLYLNRELSWIEFNYRVLERASDSSIPFLERLKFLAISATNLDEFFMVRVAGLQQQVAGKIEERGPDGLTPAAQLREVSRRTHELVARQYHTVREELIPGLREIGVELTRPRHFRDDESAFIKRYFDERVFPVLTPLAVDPGHPFPNLRNRSLNLAVRLRRRRRTLSLGVVTVPSVLDRFLTIPGNGENARPRVAWLEDVIALHVGSLFPGTVVESCYPFRVTRNWDLNLDEEDADDLLVLIEKEVRRRDKGNAVRLEIDEDADDDLRHALSAALKIGDDDIYRIRGPLNLGDLMTVYSKQEGAVAGSAVRVKDEALAPTVPSPVREASSMVQAISRGDVLLHHPYESFDPVVDFIEESAADPDVLAIKMTLYRTSGDSPIVKALERAAENHKQVTAIVELKARFDEENNIAWARALEQSGVHVVYGLIGLKTHCKMSLVVRKEGDILRRYLHLGTGNYNPATARVYTDLSFFTAREDFCRDASALFNLLTGNASVNEWETFAVAPLDLQDRILGMIDEVSEAAAAGKPAHICAKMNALVDGDVIRALYRASQAGARIDLLVRGVCCLRPGVPGVSDNIRVRSVVDRFLEHSRVFHFVAGDKDRVYLSSADWMPRNFQRRVEVMFPVDDPALSARLVREVLHLMNADAARGWELSADGTYRIVPPVGSAESYRPQIRFLEIAAQADKAPPPLRPVGPPSSSERDRAAG